MGSHTYLVSFFTLPRGRERITRAPGDGDWGGDSIFLEALITRTGAGTTGEGGLSGDSAFLLPLTFSESVSAIGCCLELDDADVWDVAGVGLELAVLDDGPDDDEFAVPKDDALRTEFSVVSLRAAVCLSDARDTVGVPVASFEELSETIMLSARARANLTGSGSAFRANFSLCSYAWARRRVAPLCISVVVQTSISVLDKSSSSALERVLRHILPISRPNWLSSFSQVVFVPSGRRQPLHAAYKEEN